MAVRDTSMIHKCMKTLSSGAILKMPLVSALIFGSAAYAGDTFTESPHTFTEESIEYTTDLRIGDSGKTMYVTNNTTAIKVGNSKNFAVGAEANGIGSYVQNGGSLSATDIYVGRNNTGTGYFELNGGTVTASGTAYLGSNGGVFTGKMTGGSLTANQIFLADGSTGSQAAFTQDGGAVTNKSWFVVGRGVDNSVLVYNALYTLNNGTFVHQSDSVVIGCWGNAGTKAKLTVNGGSFTSTSSGDVRIGEKAAGELEVNGGLFDVGNSVINFFSAASDSGEKSSLKLGKTESAKGRLRTKQIKFGTGSGSAEVMFDGGTLEATASGTLVAASVNLAVIVGENGGTVDNGIYAVTIAEDIAGIQDDPNTSDTVDSDGGMTFTGKGITTLTGAATYTGTTFVESGVLALTNGYSFVGPVKVGKNGAITVDITAANTASALEVGSKIALFSASALSFEESTDDLSTSVFLTGPVVGYTLSSEPEEGRTTVYATITDVTNIATSRKVTTYVMGDVMSRFDYDSSYSNGAPADNSFDVVVFPGDASVYTHNQYNNSWKWGYAPRRCGDLVLRGGTVFVTTEFIGYPASKTRGDPPFGVKHVTGRGVLKFSLCGLVNDNYETMYIDDAVDVEACLVGATLSDNPHATWIGGYGTTTVGGDFYSTNGFVRVDSGVVFGGDVTIGFCNEASSLNTDGTSFSGDLILLDGATFNCNGKTATFGEDARLVLKGGTLANTANITAWPKTVIQGGVYAYGSVPGAAEYTIEEGGRLNVVPPEDGTSFSLTGVKLADGVNAADVIKITGTQYNWTVAVDAESGSITATVGAPYDSTEPTYWVGGSQGMWKEKVNWSRGVPNENMTAVFTYDASCFYSDGTAIIGKIGKLVLNGHHVELATKDYSATPWGKFEVGEFDEYETGTLRIFRSGLGNIGGRNLTLPSTMRLEVLSAGDKDCWLADDNGIVTFNCPIVKLDDRLLKLIGDVHVMGGISGPGTVKPRDTNATDSPDKCRSLGGDWSGFTGTFAPDNTNERTFFTESFTGGENSSWYFPHYIRIDGSERTLKLGQVTFTDGRRIEVLKGAAITLETGARNTSFTINANVAFYENPDEQNWSGTSDQFTKGAANCTLKKTGTGTLTSNLVGAFTLDVAEGVCALASGDANVNVTVREGATLLAANNVTIGSLACESGANIRLTTLESNPVMTVDGTAVVDGANVTLADGLADTLSTQTDPASYTILNAGTISGTPAGKFACEEKNMFWIAKAASGTLNLTRRPALSGLFIIVH